MKAPIIEVGIFSRKAISFSFNDNYIQNKKNTLFQGGQPVLWEKGKIIFEGNSYDELLFEPVSQEATFDLESVTIGVDFHWQREETQRFPGALKLLATEEGILAINRVDAERYLSCVISSEMNAEAPEEFLKAHAVISRSWLLSQLEKKGQSAQKETSCHRGEDYLIRWYDREDHTLFDVCADDHCQRYQGVSRSAGHPKILQLLQETNGEVLTYLDNICDTRFSKCCGGATEEFEHCWEPIHHPYLSQVRDLDSSTLTDLSNERNAEEWIRSAPDAFCNTSDQRLLGTILNNYDQETTDFYRWQVRYSQEEIAELIHRKSSIPFGQIIDLIPLKRGKSGRIEELRIVGTNCSFTVGKELEIRRTLSESHLYSSAFVVDKEWENGENIPSAFVLSGAGWGHGVGLCQIGAAVMSSKGYSYRQILSHYFPGAQLERRY